MPTPPETSRGSPGPPCAGRRTTSGLFSVVYDELHALARRHMRQERADHTLQATALVHEAYVRLVDDLPVGWESRARFLTAASEVIRRILIDHARRHRAAKRGGRARKVRLSEASCHAGASDVDLLALDEALEELRILKDRHYRVVQLRFFGGLSIEQTADLLEVSIDTVKADWRAARAWLRRRLQTGDGDGDNAQGLSADHQPVQRGV